ncbi:MAG: PIN domain-containing protein [Pseudonocardia sp.]|nr:PIN domain-containing protein [Pseudonocardia sp.]
MIADTSGLLALFNEREPRHADVRAALDGEREPLVVSPYVVAELDYLVGTRIGVAAELAVLRELSGPGYELAAVDAELLAEAAAVVERYADQHIGVADASNVVLAKRYRTDRMLTLDRRHFEVLRTGDGRAFQLLP